MQYLRMSQILADPAIANLLLAVIAFFLVRFYLKFEKTTEEVAVMQRTQAVHEKTLEQHAETLSEHSEAIRELLTKKV